MRKATMNGVRVALLSLGLAVGSGAVYAQDAPGGANPGGTPARNTTTDVRTDRNTTDWGWLGLAGLAGLLGLLPLVLRNNGHADRMRDNLAGRGTTNH